MQSAVLSCHEGGRSLVWGTFSTKMRCRMINHLRTQFMALIALTFILAPVLVDAKDAKDAKKGAKKMDNKVVVVMDTSIGGPIEIELFQDKAPESVKNFLAYVDEKFYDGTIFHRVIDNFMIQGGGFTKDMGKKETKAPIKNEATNGLKNENYTLAMARTQIVDSATAQFFINVKDNGFLDHKDTSIRGYGYAVFGKVVKGTEIVDKIKAVETHTVSQYENVPKTPVVIKSIKRK